MSEPGCLQYLRLNQTFEGREPLQMEDHVGSGRGHDVSEISVSLILGCLNHLLLDECVSTVVANYVETDRYV